MEVKVIQDRMMRKFGIKILNHTCWRARRIMKAIIEGRHEEGYQVLPQYLEEFKKKNPTFVCLINWQDRRLSKNLTFKRCIICIGSAIEAVMENCRPLIGIDACHLKGPYKGILLTAMTLDGNNGQFSLAYGVTSIENEEEWSFFLDSLAIALGAREYASRYTIMSDRHKGIIAALGKIMPQASRRICVLHFYKNFAANYPGAWFHSFFCLAANAYSAYVFEKAMKKIKEKQPAAYNWLRDNEPICHWARFKYDTNLKCDDNTNNFVESFNHTILKHMGKPMYTMLEEIRKLVGSRFVKRYSIASSWDGKLTPHVQNKLKGIEFDAQDCTQVVAAGRGQFDVCNGFTNYTVRLNDRYCDCQKWQITGLPCKHEARCILRMNHSLEDYCSEWFHVDKYKKLYDNISCPVADSCFWESTDVPQLDPPFELKKIGRPSKHKRRESVFHPDQPSQESTRISGTKRCKKCNQLGHNARTCGLPRDDCGKLLTKYKKKQKVGCSRPVGRPHKSQETQSSQGIQYKVASTHSSQANM